MSFLKDFLLYVSGCECPPPYAIWTAYSMLSAAIGRRIFLDLQYFKVWPNIYVILVGPSGTRKTVATDMGVVLLQAAIPDISFSANNETYQGTITFMDSENSVRSYFDHNGKAVEYKPYFIVASELMNYIQNNPDGYIKFLTDIYDRPDQFIYRLKNEQRVLLRPYVVMCACTTANWLTDQIKQKTFSEGFGRRCIIVCNSNVVRKWPEMTDPMKAAASRCITRLVDVQKLAGPCILEPDALDLFKQWYLTHKRPSDTFLSNWYSTKNILVLKVAMLISISERDDRVITKDYIELSLALLDSLEKEMPMVTDLLGRSELVGPAATIVGLLRSNGGSVAQKWLLAKTYKEFKDSKEQYGVLKHLEETGQIVILDHTVDNMRKVMVALPGAVQRVEPKA